MELGTGSNPGGLRHRVAIYGDQTAQAIAVFTRQNHATNEVAFHPSRAVVAIASGQYDGGFIYHGELWLWDWNSGRARSVLPDSRDVASVRWTDETSLEAILRPVSDEYGDYERVSVDVSRWLRDAGSDGPESAPVMRQSMSAADDAILAVDGPDPTDAGPAVARRALGSEFVPRTWIQGLTWLSDRYIALCHSGCHAEVWDIETGHRVANHRGDGSGVQLVRALGGVVVNVRATDGVADGGIRLGRSSLHRLTTRELLPIQALERPVVLSTDAAGNLLCRDASGARKTRDVLIPSNGGADVRLSLGPFDASNHRLSVKGSEELLFLRTVAANAHAQLCRLDVTGAVKELMDWGVDRRRLRFNCASRLPDDTIVRSYVEWPSGEARVERLNVHSGKLIWQRKLDDRVLALEVVGRNVACALRNGQLSLLDIESGETRYESVLNCDGVPTFATALAVGSSAIAVGTVEGRVIILGIEG